VPEKVHFGVSGFMRMNSRLLKHSASSLPSRKPFGRSSLQQHEVFELRLFSIVAAITLPQDELYAGLKRQGPLRDDLSALVREWEEIEYGKPAEGSGH